MTEEGPVIETLQGWGSRPAIEGRAATAGGLLALAALVPLHPEPGELSFLSAIAALVAVAAGALWTARRLDREGSFDLTGRILAVLIVGALALITAPRAKLFGTDLETALVFVTLGTGLAACGLFAWFVLGVHRQLRGDERPLFLLAALASLLVSVPVQDADLLPIVAFSIPLVCLAVELFRGSPTIAPPAEPL